MRGKRTTAQCLHCGDPFEARCIKVRQGKAIFCSRQCYNDHRSQNKLDKKSAERAYQIKHKYGLDADQYRSMLEDQSGKCAICLVPFGDHTPRVDHDHKTDAVRGLLCNACNTGLGAFRDSIDSLRSAVEYLNGAVARSGSAVA